MMSEVKGVARYAYEDLRGQVGGVSIVADDVTAPDDAELAAVLADMQQRVRDDDGELEFRSGRFTVTIALRRGGGLQALAAALNASRGQSKPMTP